ncbi:MAG TPA: hypothetical protein VFX59_23045 [Polyangiales bacterium]|nr:hypothetical protein [Polyangiales bacterium]
MQLALALLSRWVLRRLAVLLGRRARALLGLASALREQIAEQVQSELAFRHFVRLRAILLLREPTHRLELTVESLHELFDLADEVLRIRDRRAVVVGNA